VAQQANVARDSARRLEWSDAARRQLIEQVEYVAARGIALPDVVLECVEYAGQLLEQNPYIGTPGRVAGTREWPIRHSPLTIICRVRPSKIQVLRWFISGSSFAEASTYWIADSLGCKVTNPQPQPIETITWSGHCKDGFVDGAGTVAWFSEGKVNGITSGTFKEGKLNGKGYVTLPFAVYARVNVGKRNVEVRRTWPPGSRLDGEFVDNQLIGDGIITTPNGQKVVVNQIDGKLVRKRPVTHAPRTLKGVTPQ